MGQVIKDQKIYFGALALEGQIHTIDLDLSKEPLDDTRLGDNSVQMIAGRGATALQLAGFWDPTTASSTDAQLFSDVGSTLGYIIDVTNGGEGSLAYFGDILAQARPFSGSHGQNAGMTIAGATRNTIPIQGYLSEVSTGLSTGSVNGTGINLGAVAAGSKLWAALCITAGSSPDVDVIIESDSDNTFATATTQITFANATATGSQVLSADGAITDTWFRAVVTVNSGTGINVAVAVGIW